MLALALCVVLKDRSRFEQVLEDKREFLLARKDTGLAKVMAATEKMRLH